MKAIIGVLAALTLAACGGGGGNSGGNSVGNSSVGSSSAISSVATGVCGSAGIIFAECINSSWGLFKTWEQSTETGLGDEYLTPTNAGNVQWQLVTAAAAGHNQVVKVNYGQKTNVSTQFQVISATPLNLSTYGTGTLSFDINVLEFGSAYNSLAGNMVFDVRVECSWPCSSHTAKVPVSTRNNWQHVEILVADMVRTGLDLTKVDSSFIIRPLNTPQNGVSSPQNGVSFQLDNIEWKKGTAPLPAASTAVFEEHFNTRASADAWSYVYYDGASGQISGAKFLSEGLFLIPSWGSSYDLWSLETSLAKAITIKNKQASLQIFIDRMQMDSYGSSIEFQLIAKDGNGRVAETPYISSNALLTNEWSEVSWSIGNSFLGGFNAADVRKLGIRFFANGKPASVSTFIQLDTIRIY